MIRIRTGSRLHFGPLTLGGSPPAREFGGVGMMIDGPGIVLEACSSRSWSADGPLANRVRAFIDRLKTDSQSPLHFAVREAPPEHIGLGTGTQLALAVARAMNVTGDIVDLASRVGRGARSAIGVHGFDQGGFLVEGGKTIMTAIAPLISRLAFPEDWRVVVMYATESRGKHGLSEKDAFAELKKLVSNEARTDRLCRLVLLEMLPALMDRDLDCFGEAVFQYNWLAGDAFAPVQGGRYASPAAEALVDFSRQFRIRGAGQSSWGSAMFAIARDQEEATDFAKNVRSRFNDLIVHVCRGLNRGAEIDVASGEP